MLTEETTKELIEAVNRQTDVVASVQGELSKFATHADLEDRVERLQGVARRARWRTRLVISLIAAVLAGGAYWRSNQAVHRVCIAENLLISKDRQIIEVATRQLPVNPSAPADIQAQITQRNSASAAFRVQLESGILLPIGCPSTWP